MSLLMQAPLDAAYGAFGLAAIYTPPGGSPAPCTVILDSEDRSVSFGESRPFAQGNLIRVRTSEIAAPAKGGVFAPPPAPAPPNALADTFTILGDPQAEDPERLEWTCRVA